MSNGGANVRAIDAFVAMSGNIGASKAAARVMAICILGFNYNAMLQKPPVGRWLAYRERRAPPVEFRCRRSDVQQFDRS